MTDIVSAAVRSRMMSGIRGRDTRPEIAIRHGLHRLGFRYSLHGSGLPGRPDIVLPRWHAVVLVNGCFWHGHDCALFRWPDSRREFWRQKISRNQARDTEVRDTLSAAGWRVLVIWECALKGPRRQALDEVMKETSGWIKRGTLFHEIRGLEHARC